MKLYYYCLNCDWKETVTIIRSKAQSAEVHWRQHHEATGHCDLFIETDEVRKWPNTIRERRVIAKIEEAA